MLNITNGDVNAGMWDTLERKLKEIKEMVPTEQAPTNATSPGVPGTIRFDDDYLYFCIEENRWVRIEFTTW